MRAGGVAALIAVLIAAFALLIATEGWGDFWPRLVGSVLGLAVVAWIARRDARRPRYPLPTSAPDDETPPLPHREPSTDT